MAIAAVTDELATTSADYVDDAAVAIAKAEADRWRRRYLLLVATIVMMGIGYVLSPAIVIALEKRGAIPRPVEYVVQVLMYPLELAYENSDLVQSFYAGYFELIGVDE
ncbi:MAG: hypothetical protein JWP89_6003 [Schlesneria sp.]|nr:hypothetical protein [Schlesneria sp.]